jgi:hypothetical protein
MDRRHGDAAADGRGLALVPLDTDGGDGDTEGGAFA